MKVDPDFWRRLKIYLIGFGIGMLVVSVLFKGRTVCKMPGTIKREKLYSQHIVFTKEAVCYMECNKVSTADLAQVFVQGSVNYSEDSNPQAKPCGIYAVDGEIADKREIRIIVHECDTISRITAVKELGKKGWNTCGCDHSTSM